MSEFMLSMVICCGFILSSVVLSLFYLLWRNERVFDFRSWVLNEYGVENYYKMVDYDTMLFDDIFKSLARNSDTIKGWLK